MAAKRTQSRKTRDRTCALGAGYLLCHGRLMSLMLSVVLSAALMVAVPPGAGAAPPPLIAAATAVGPDGRPPDSGSINHQPRSSRQRSGRRSVRADAGKVGLDLRRHSPGR